MITWNQLLGQRRGNLPPARSALNSSPSVAPANLHEIRQSLRRKIASQLTDHSKAGDALGPEGRPARRPEEKNSHNGS
jgi:hypothetical protein